MQARRPAFLRFTATLVLVTTITGCASSARLGPPNPNDPWEEANRAIYSFNDALDRNIFVPIAEGYAYITPQPIRTCISNIFQNLGELWSFINSNLQGRHEDAINTMGRFMLNTTMGLGGCLDLASKNGAPRIPNDFGTTLGVWGVNSGPYIVLPLLGPSTMRDGIGRGVDLYVNQIGWGKGIEDIDLRNSLYGLEFVERREGLLTVTETVDQTAIDPYSFIRDAYLQRRKAQIRGTKGEDEPLPNYEDLDADSADKNTLNTPTPQ